MSLKKRSLKSSEAYIQGIISGNRVLLGQALTLVESKKQDHRIIANEILNGLHATSSKSIRIGISGSPGVGKSTFIEAFGTYLLKQEKRLAVLAVDPSSSVTKGSILGDKTRMQTLSVKENVFIRPSPAAETLGGVTNTTHESILLCEAAGYDVILVETVGVGQSETMVHSLVDFFMLLLLPGAGDDLQGIKRGIVELADMIVVNKVDGDRIALANEIKRAYQNAIHFFGAKTNNWTTKVFLASALEGKGLEKIWEEINAFDQKFIENGFKASHRKAQREAIFTSLLKARFWDQMLNDPTRAAQLKSLQKSILDNDLSIYEALDMFFE